MWLPLPKARPPAADQRRRHAAHHWRSVRLHDQHGQKARAADPLAARVQADPRQRGVSRALELALFMDAKLNLGAPTQKGGRQWPGS
jgi:hypothetical protein